MKTATKLTRDVHGSGNVDQFGYMATGEEGAFAHSFWEFLYQAGADDWTLSSNGTADPKAKAGPHLHEGPLPEGGPQGHARHQLRRGPRAT